MSNTAAELDAASGRTPPPSPNKKADSLGAKAAKAELAAAKKAERAAVKKAEQQEKRLEQLRGKVSVLQDQLKVLMQQMHTTVEVRGRPPPPCCFAGFSSGIRKPLACPSPGSAASVVATLPWPPRLDTPSAAAAGQGGNA